jgi:hypothetical protein
MPVAARPPGHKAFLAVGEHEEGPMNLVWPPMAQLSQDVHDKVAMVSDCMKLAEHLRTSGADVEAVVVPGEQHLTVWPAASARGLRHLYLA